MPEPRVNKRKKKSCSNNCCVLKRVSSEYGELQIINDDHSLVATNKSGPGFIQNISSPLEPGICITLQGYIKPECSRFAVNVTCDKEPNSDIAIHINPRLSQRYVVRNSLIHGRWGEEETTSAAKFELHRNKKFELDIFLTDNAFYVSINGKHICAYVYRMSLTRMKYIQVDGAVDVLGLNYKRLDAYPKLPPDYKYYSITMGEMDYFLEDQVFESPVTALLPKGFQQGWQLEIYGRVKILPSSFYINLQEGTNIWPHPVVHLHLNPRFQSFCGKHLLVRNAWVDGDWGQEERTPGYQFSPAATFGIAIRRTEDYFTLWVDGQLVGEFRFRASPDKLNTVYIQGDIIIKGLYMKTRIDDKYFQKNVTDLTPIGF